MVNLNYRYPHEIAKSQLDELKIPIDTSIPYLLLLCHIDSDESLDVLKRTKQNLSIHLILENKLSFMCSCYSFQVEYHRILVFLQPENTTYVNDNMWGRMIMYVEEMLDEIQNTIRVTLKLSASLALSSKYCSWNEFGERYKRLKMLLDFQKAGKTGVIVTDKLEVVSLLDVYQDQENYSNNDFQREHMMSELKEYLESGSKEKCIKLMDQCNNLIGNNNGDINSNIYLEIFYSISILLLSYINRWNLTQLIEPKIELKYLTRVDNFLDCKASFDYLKKVVESILDIMFQEQEKQLIQTVNRIRKYIKNNLAGDLSLVNLSQVVNYNPSYLSRIFHQVTNTTISEYKNDVRLSKIKELIKNPDIKINRIATVTGFDSAAYFSRFFKKVMGITPQQYRNIKLKQNERSKDNSTM